MFCCSIHRLVLETFIGPCPDGMECCHNNGDPVDNRLGNLRWDTHFNNVQDSIKHGTRADFSGEKNSQVKLNNLQVRVIRRLLEFGRLTQKEIGALFNIVQTTICNINTRKLWRHI